MSRQNSGSGSLVPSLAHVQASPAAASLKTVVSSEAANCDNLPSIDAFSGDSLSAEKNGHDALEEKLGRLATKPGVRAGIVLDRASGAIIKTSGELSALRTAKSRDAATAASFSNEAPTAEASESQGVEDFAAMIWNYVNASAHLVQDMDNEDALRLLRLLLYVNFSRARTRELHLTQSLKLELKSELQGCRGLPEDDIESGSACHPYPTSRVPHNVPSHIAHPPLGLVGRQVTPPRLPRRSQDSFFTESLHLRLSCLLIVEVYFPLSAHASIRGQGFIVLGPQTSILRQALLILCRETIAGVDQSSTGIIAVLVVLSAGAPEVVARLELSCFTGNVFCEVSLSASQRQKGPSLYAIASF
ncbi:hypothetical protein E4U15_006229 [Claviceps sp. LM218 group G6]|nr:hypothetical protein E4U15_006229 [Claviceps sp. LM218 group G6]